MRKTHLFLVGEKHHIETMIFRWKIHETALWSHPNRTPTVSTPHHLNHDPQAPSSLVVLRQPRSRWKRLGWICFLDGETRWLSHGRTVLETFATDRPRQHQWGGGECYPRKWRQPCDAAPQFIPLFLYWSSLKIIFFLVGHQLEHPFNGHAAPENHSTSFSARARLRDYRWKLASLALWLATPQKDAEKSIFQDVSSMIFKFYI